MILLLKIAWKNIWRSKVRSFVVIGSVVVGIWALIFLMSFVTGLIISYVNSGIKNETSHVQIHHPKYSEDREIKFLIPDIELVKRNLESNPEVQSYAERLLINGMLSTANGVRGAMVKGIKPEEELNVTQLNEAVIEGTFFGGSTKNQMLISQSMAKKIKAKLKSKVVINFQKYDGELTAAAFKIVGIFKTGNPKTDELTAFVKYDDISRTTEILDGGAHEIAILIRDIELVDTFKNALATSFPRIEVKTYKQISPDLELFKTQIRLNMIIMTTIVMLALIFGIINTMLMAVLERMKELGMLMAIGMNKVRVFFMIVLETILIACVGAPIGMLLGYLTVKGLYTKGIDLSMWSKGLEKFGMSNVVRPALEADIYYTIAIAIIITAILGSIYPSLKAIKLKPVEALRKI